MYDGSDSHRKSKKSNSGSSKVIPAPEPIVLPPIQQQQNEARRNAYMTASSMGQQIVCEEGVSDDSQHE